MALVHREPATKRHPHGPPGIGSLPPSLIEENGATKQDGFCQGLTRRAAIQGEGRRWFLALSGAYVIV